MLKLLGGLCVLLGGVMGRRVQMAERRRTRDMLSDFITALRRMGEAVRIARTPLPALLDRLAQDCGAEAAAFFHGVAEAARRGEEFPEHWRRLAAALPLKEGERRVLAELGQDIQGDEEKACKAITLVIVRLEQIFAEAERRRPDEEKRVSALWFSAAALLVILLV